MPREVELFDPTIAALSLCEKEFCWQYDGKRLDDLMISGCSTNYWWSISLETYKHHFGVSEETRSKGVIKAVYKGEQNAKNAMKAPKITIKPSGMQEYWKECVANTCFSYTYYKFTIYDIHVGDREAHFCKISWAIFKQTFLRISCAITNFAF